MSVSDDGLDVTVRDHGPGIAPIDLPHVFDRFYRGAEAKRWVSGTGMGLSIARGMLAAERRTNLGRELPGRRRTIQHRRSGAEQGGGGRSDPVS